MLFASNSAFSVFTMAAFYALPQGTHAWGSLGHQTVGYVAMEFLSSGALSFVQDTISDTYDNSLGPAAPWADTVRSTDAFKFSAPFHFIDAEDDPLGGSCSVQQSRDCKSNGCILTAISNYTQRVADDSLSTTQRQQALMFLDHFLGDIGQPLHVEQYEVGGNDIHAICGGASTNLHAAWDTGMLKTMLDADYGGAPATWATALVKEIKTGSYKTDAADWISCSSTTQTQKRAALTRTLREEVLATIHARASLPELECPLVWAQEANAYDCSAVFDYSDGEDLCTGDYFNAAIPIIKLQIAKQGYRLAAWLNVIFDGATNLP